MNVIFSKEQIPDVLIGGSYKASQLVFRRRSEFPEVGKSNILYIATDEGSTYIYDSSLNIYVQTNADKTHVHKQIAPLDVWTITHNLNKYCSVMVTDSAGSVVIGDISYDDLNTVTITFSSPFSGKAYCN